MGLMGELADWILENGGKIRGVMPRFMKEIVMTLRYAPVLRDFDETADRPLLSKLEDLYGCRDGICMTEGESLTIDRKDS